MAHTAARPQVLVGVLLHLSVLVFAMTGVVRMAQIGHPLCVAVIALSSVLALCYAAGLVCWERLAAARPAWLGVLLLTWLALILVVPPPYSVSFSWLALPLALTAQRVLSLRAGTVVAAGIALVLAVYLGFREGFQLDLIVPPVLAVAAVTALYNAQQREIALRHRLLLGLTTTRDELAVRQRQAGELAERARIARDIHDTLAQELAGSRMLLQAAQRDWSSDPDSALRNVQIADIALGENLVQARRMIADLSPAELDDSDLAAALETVCERERGYGHAAVGFRVTGEPQALDQHSAAALLRTAQGALANVRDHAMAGRVEVALDWQPDQVRLRVSDDGVGFDRAHRQPGEGRGYGFAALRDRLALSLGTLDVRSAPGVGTAVLACVPVLREPAVLTGAMP